MFSLLWVFLVVKEIFKRRNFDLDTLNAENNAEPMSVWILKTAITSIVIIAVMLGSTLFLVVFDFLSMDEYLTTFRSDWIIFAAVIVALFIIQTIGEVIKRQWRKRRRAKSKPSHLA